MKRLKELWGKIVNISDDTLFLILLIAALVLTVLWLSV